MISAPTAPTNNGSDGGHHADPVAADPIYLGTDGRGPETIVAFFETGTDAKLHESVGPLWDERYRWHVAAKVEAARPGLRSTALRMLEAKAETGLPRHPPAQTAAATPYALPAVESVQGALPPLWKPTRAIDLVNAHPQRRPAVIDGLNRRGENMNIIAMPKIGKSWLVTDLALAVSTGRRWLGRFNTTRGRVLILDNELHSETTASRIPKIAAARGLLTDEWADTLDCENVRSQNLDLYGLRRMFDRIARGEYSLIVLDAWYRFQPVGTDENDNGTQASLFNQLDLYAHQLGTSFAIVHHSSKGVQGNKSVVDVGSGAGSMARAADSHFVLREHAEDGAIVIDAAVRSWKPIQPFVVRREQYVFNPDENLDPLHLKTESRRGQSRGDKGEGDGEPVVPWTAEEFVRRFITPAGRTKDEILIDADAADPRQAPDDREPRRDPRPEDGDIFLAWSDRKWVFDSAAVHV